jgi:predicted nucleotidyltransferase
VKLRDRDAIITKEGLIFRVFGNDHPEGTYICDAEYASAKIFNSKDPRASRTGSNQLFFKFYNDEGLNLVFEKFSHYTFFYELLNEKLLGVRISDIFKIRKPQKRFKKIISEKPTDELIDATQRVFNTLKDASDLSLDDFGVFGSMLHGFHHPKFSDIDLVVYGKDANLKMCKTLEELYSDVSSDYSNEFENENVMSGKLWRFKDFNLKEYVWHQKRKQIYGLFNDSKSGRIIKAEFEPVKKWNEITPNYEQSDRIFPKGWTRIKARVIGDDESPFIPSIYEIEPISVINGPKSAMEVTRIFSYMEEFRQQVRKDENIIVEGTLEEVSSNKRSFHQITLTYCPRYYDQVLKVNNLNL